MFNERCVVVVVYIVVVVVVVIFYVCILQSCSAGVLCNLCAGGICLSTTGDCVCQIDACARNEYFPPWFTGKPYCEY